jgi:F-type H+-transporting ATPase subunit b
MKRRTFRLFCAAGLVAALTGMTLSVTAAAEQAGGNPAGARPVPRHEVPGGRMPASVGPGHVESAPPHGEGAAAEHAEEHEGPPGPMNWFDFSNKEQPPYLAAVINFAILAFIYVYFGKKPIMNALRGRREGVSKQIEEAQKIKHEAEARSKQYAAKLEALGMELETTKAALATAGVGEKARIVREAEERAARMQKDAQLLIEQERAQMHADLQREAVAAALEAAETVLRTKLTQADQERVAEEFLATLNAKPVAAGSAGGAS